MAKIQIPEYEEPCNRVYAEIRYCMCGCWCDWVYSRVECNTELYVWLLRLKTVKIAVHDTVWFDMRQVSGDLKTNFTIQDLEGS